MRIKYKVASERHCARYYQSLTHDSVTHRQQRRQIELMTAGHHGSDTHLGSKSRLGPHCMDWAWSVLVSLALYVEVRQSGILILLLLHSKFESIWAT